MQNLLWKKVTAPVVIVLFLGVAFSPGITASRDIIETNELNSDLVEITVEIGNHDHSVLLTAKQALELENLIDRTKTRLDTATTPEETAQIFDETVVSLYDIGVLPKDMSIREVQRLVNGHHRFSRMENVLDGLSGSNLGLLDDNENLFCLIAGKTSDTFFLPLIYRFIGQLNELPFGWASILWIILFILLSPLCLLWLLSPVVYGNYAVLGIPGMWGSPSTGWVRTIGWNGIKNWNGSFKGGINLPTHGGEGYACLGIRGFNGISIYYNLTRMECFYLGSALQVKLKYYNHSVFS